MCGVIRVYHWVVVYHWPVDDCIFLCLHTTRLVSLYMQTAVNGRSSPGGHT